MSDFGPPPGPPGPSGPPAGAKSGSSQQVVMLSYAAAALGVLGFVWGFLDWLSTDSGVGSNSASGYESLGSAAVGLLLAAGLLAGAGTLEKKDLTLAPAAVSVAGLLVALGVLLDHGDEYSAGIGLILTFITAIVQAAALIVAWMLATERMPALGGGKSSGSPNQWQQGPVQQGFGPQGPQPPQGPGQFGGYPGEQGQFGPPPGPGFGQPSGPPPGYGQPSGPPPGYGQPSGPPPGYGQPSGPPPGYGQPSGPPPGYGPPQPGSPPPPSGGAHSQPPSEASSDEGGASRTQVLPRYQPDQSFQPGQSFQPDQSGEADQNATRHGIPIFDPNSRPDERPADRPGE